MIKLAPTGRLSTGHVLDVAKRPFERALQDFDSQLYVEWNPKKLKGWGCWEIRRMPAYKSIVETAQIGDTTIVRLEYLENDVENHVLDCAFLNYDQLRKIKSMDTWNKNHWINDLEYHEQQNREKQREAARKEFAYTLKQNKRVFGELKELVRSGKNIHRILTNNGQNNF